MRRMTKTTRRQFLETAGGASAIAWSGFAHAGAQPRGAARDGIVDFHAHWVGPHVAELLKGRTSPRPPQGPAWYDVDARLRDMDANGVARQVLAWVSASFDGALPPDDARPLWRAQ